MSKSNSLVIPSCNEKVISTNQKQEGLNDLRRRNLMKDIFNKYYYYEYKFLIKLNDLNKKQRFNFYTNSIYLKTKLPIFASPSS